jgi:hypothetical protein
MLNRSHLFLLLGLCLSMLTGCGDDRPSRVPVSGKVTIDGQPVTSGSVSFQPQLGRVAGGQLDEQGRFTLTTFDKGDGCVPGKHAVTVHSTEQLNGNTIRWNVPKKYKNKSTSGLEVTVDGPTDNLEIELTWDGKKGPLLEKMERSE